MERLDNFNRNFSFESMQLTGNFSCNYGGSLQDIGEENRLDLENTDLKE